SRNTASKIAGSVSMPRWTGCVQGAAGGSPSGGRPGDELGRARCWRPMGPSRKPRNRWAAATSSLPLRALAGHGVSPFSVERSGFRIQARLRSAITCMESKVMDMNEYALEILARDRLAELRAAAELANRVRAARPVSRPLRVVLGQALIRMGHRLQGVRRSPRRVRRGWRGQATRGIDAPAERG